MEQYIQIICRYCGSKDLVKNGHSGNGTQRYRCNNCKKSFRTEYSCNARKPGVKEQIGKQTLNSSGIRDTGRNLEISKNTVISELKKRSCRDKSVFSDRCSKNSGFGSWNTYGCGSWRILELCRQQKKSALDAVCDRTEFRDCSCVA